jgi:2-keto-4-pentenoate hydratase/2-oxohepta-3-ene-1,7-dioic acid hydratase in catechol pathway
MNKQTGSTKMRYVRFQHKNKQSSFGWMRENEIGLIAGDLFGDYRRLDSFSPLDQSRLMAPVLPGKIIGVGRNYREHAVEQGVEIPEIPLIFLKPPSSVIGADDSIILPPQSKEVVHEAELAIVIGKKGRWIHPEEAFNFIFGFCIGNDVTARDLQRRDGQWTRGKGFDTFCCLGPWIETDLDVADALVSCRVNGELRQMASTREMVFSIPQLIAYISSIMTIEPGDVIMTGTPAGSSPLKAGDLVEVSVEGIGAMTNKVSAFEG